MNDKSYSSLEIAWRNIEYYMGLKMEWSKIKEGMKKFISKDFSHVKLHLILFGIFMLMNLITYIIFLFSPEDKLLPAIGLFFGFKNISNINLNPLWLVV